jgi:CHRD domain
VKTFAMLVLAATIAVLASAAFAGAATRATTITFAAKLTAKAEVPPQTWKNPGASGSFTGDITGNEMKWTLKFTGLTGTTTAVNIDLGAVGTSGPVVVRLCGQRCPAEGTSTLSKALLKDLKAHMLYINLDTKKNPKGEIRGQVSEG